MGHKGALGEATPILEAVCAGVALVSGILMTSIQSGDSMCFWDHKE